MTEHLPKGTQNTMAMEGRAFDAKGKDLGDTQFHEVGFNSTGEAAKQDLERMAAAEMELAEQQAERFASYDAAMGIKAYEGLIAIYRTDPIVERWKARLEALKQE